MNPRNGDWEKRYMINLKGLLRKIRDRLLGKDRKTLIEISPPAREAIPASVSQVELIPKQRPQREPYFVQIGFDFGTAYSKCVCRDLIINKAWIYLPPGSECSQYPFLISSVVLFRKGKLSHVENTGCDYHADGLNHLKHALEKVALGKLNDPVLDHYRNFGFSSNSEQFAKFVENCAVYFLAGIFGEIRKHIRQRLPGFGLHPDDYMAVNMGIPVADAERPEVNSLYQKVLYEAWLLADQLSGHPSIDISEVDKLLLDLIQEENSSSREACFIYPETSANVQGFVRSRVSSPGIYLFSDTGAGTVDQSVFIFLRTDHGEHLTYLHGSVIPLGSSFIERRAALAAGRIDWSGLEDWRQMKESGENHPLLAAAKNEIHEELVCHTEETLARAKRKLIVKDQLNEIRVIFGGGGHCEHPYKTAVLRPFSGGLFRRGISPDVLGIPVPRDLELEAGQTKWMNRLSVAYGLSFEKNELSTFTYPVEVETPKYEEIWRPQRRIQDAPSKEVC